MIIDLPLMEKTGNAFLKTLNQINTYVELKESEDMHRLVT